MSGKIVILAFEWVLFFHQQFERIFIINLSQLVRINNIQSKLESVLSHKVFNDIQLLVRVFLLSVGSKIKNVFLDVFEKDVA